MTPRRSAQYLLVVVVVAHLVNTSLIYFHTLLDHLCLSTTGRLYVRSVCHVRRCLFQHFHQLYLSTSTSKLISYKHDKNILIIKNCYRHTQLLNEIHSKYHKSKYLKKAATSQTSIRSLTQEEEKISKRSRLVTYKDVEARGEYQTA